MDSSKRVAALEAKAKQLKARIRLLKAKSAHSERKMDTRRKVLVGAMMLEKAEKDPALKSRIHNELATWLRRDIDRQAFGFDPLPKSHSPAPTH